MHPRRHRARFEQLSSHWIELPHRKLGRSRRTWGTASEQEQAPGDEANGETGRNEPTHERQRLHPRKDDFSIECSHHAVGETR